MNNQSNLTNFIIVLGTTKSGSGAVFDYLNGRGDLYDPLKGQEYHLPQMPNGLMTLEAISKNAFHPGTSDYVLSRFEENSKKLYRSQSYLRYGMDYSTKVPSFQKFINQFIDEICAAKLPMHLHWRKLIETDSIMKYFILKLKKRIGFEEKVKVSRILVSQKKFIEATQKLHDKLFLNNSNNKIVLLNQAGSGWNPIESTKYFLKRKIILFTRDPRDQFAELKQIKKANSVDSFIDWYKEMQRRIKDIENPTLLKLRFEDFVNKNNQIVELICNHISLSSNIISDYKPDLSKKNIGKYKKFLNNQEIDKIENNLSEYFYDR